MSYAVKEIFYTLQGEGIQSGRVAVFCRFTGCNLWSGRQQDRQSAACAFCDTDFIGTDGENGGRYETAKDLAQTIASLWPDKSMKNAYVVFTGGEPLLQLDEMLIHEMHQLGFEVAIETNGTIEVPAGIDWVCVSPKAGTQLVAQSGNEIKVVIPQKSQDLAAYELLNFDYFIVQPMDGVDVENNTKLAVDFCLKHPKWRLGLQTHKFLKIQ